MSRSSRCSHRLLLLFFVMLIFCPALAIGATIAGNVTDDEGTPIDGSVTPILVQVLTGSPCWDSEIVDQANLDSSGNFQLEVGTVGTYYLKTNNLNHSDYVNEWYSGSASSYDCEDADPVIINTPADVISGIAFQLDVGATISGTVTNGVAGIADIGVHAYGRDCSGSYMHGSRTGADGTYAIRGLPVGADIFLNAAWEGSGLGYVEEWYDGNDGAYQCYEAVPATAGMSIDFELVPAGSISGIVMAGTSPVGDLQISIMDFNVGEWLGGTLTAADGSYTVDGLPPGDYRVEACATCSGQDFLNKYYQDAYGYEQASPVSVEAHTDTPDIDFALEQGTPIEGDISGLDGGQGIEICASNYEPAPGNGYTGIGYCTWVTGGGTNVDHYVFYVAPDRTYYVDFQAENGINVFYNGTQYGTLNIDTAPLVHAPEMGNVEGIDITLTQPVTISGTITGLTAGQPVGINAQSDEGLSFYTSINEDGSTSAPYGINVAPGIAYRIEFQPENALQAYYLEGNPEGTYTRNDASWVTATADVGGIDITITTGGSISGTLYESDGVTPVTGGKVQLMAFRGEPCEGWDWAGSAWADPATGEYRIENLPPGAYFLRTQNREESGYLNLWHDGAYGSQVCEQAVLVATDTADIDFEMVLGGSISGRVISEGLPVVSIEVNANGIGNWMHNGWATTDENGNYTILGLPAGDYQVQTYANSYNGHDLVDEYYNNVYSYAEATTLHVDLGSETPHIDFDLLAPSHISGIVSGLLPGASVWIRAACDNGTSDPEDDFSVYDNLDADAAGNAAYSLSAAPVPGFAYLLRFQSDERIQAYYREASPIGSYTEAEATALYPTTDIPNVDIQLTEGEPVTGELHDVEDGQEVTICAYATEGEVNGDCTSVVGDGSDAIPYTLKVAPGFEYTIYFYPDGGLNTEYNGTENGTWDGEEPAPITVPAGGSTGINITITQAVILSGTISGLANDQYVRINVSCDNGTSGDNSDNFGFGRSVYGDDSGTDTFDVEVGPGYTYRVEFEPENAITVYYSSSSALGTPSWDEADTIEVDTADIGGIDVTISVGGSVSGRVSDEKDGSGIEGLWVEAFQGPCWNEFIGGARTDADGNYQIDNLPPGSVYIRTSAQSDQMIYTDRWWFGSTDDYPLDCDEALPVNVESGYDTGSIDFSLSGPRTLDWAAFYLNNDRLSVEFEIFPTFRELLTGARIIDPDGLEYTFDLEADLHIRTNECNPIHYWYHDIPRPVPDGEYRLALDFKHGAHPVIRTTILAPTGDATPVDEGSMSATVNPDGSIDLRWTDPPDVNQTHRIRIYEAGGERIYKSDRIDNGVQQLQVPADALRCMEVGGIYDWRISSFNYEYQVNDRTTRLPFTYDPSTLVNRLDFFHTTVINGDLLFSWDSRPGSRLGIVSAEVSDPSNAPYYGFDLDVDWIDTATESRPYFNAWAALTPPPFPFGEYMLDVEFNDGYHETKTATVSNAVVVDVDEASMHYDLFDNGDMTFRWVLPEGITAQRYQVRIRNLDGSREYFSSDGMVDTDEIRVNFWNLRKLRQAGLYQWWIRVYTEDYSIAEFNAAQTFLYNPFDLVQPSCLFDRDFDEDVDGNDIALMAQYLEEGSLQNPEDFMADLAQSLGSVGCWE